MKRLISTGLLLVVTLCAVPNVYSCACENQRPDQAFGRSSAVFVGVFLGLTTKRIGKESLKALKFRVKNQWKGDRVDVVAVTESELQGECVFLYEFEKKGKEFLIYANFQRDNPQAQIPFHDGPCSRSKLVVNSKEDFKYLNKLQTIGR